MSVPLALAALLAGAGPALAHVKWFCAFDVAGQPRGLEQVLCANFEALTALALACLALACLAEGSALGHALTRALDRATAGARAQSETIVRATCGFFLVSLWNLGGILLTPELKTDLAWVPWLQLAMAACLVWRTTLPLVGLGIVVLFALALSRYGAFHLADYPIFLGVAAYLALTGLNHALGRPQAWPETGPEAGPETGTAEGDALDGTSDGAGRSLPGPLLGVRPLDVVRWAAAVTLMWASVEKWAYPHWTDPLLTAKPELMLGASPELFMQAAGVIEFVLAFALIWTPLVRRMAALVLAGVFVAAVVEFGKLDAVGHSGIVAVLVAVAADAARTGPALTWTRRPAGQHAGHEARHVASRLALRRAALAPLGCAAALAAFLAAYYLAHNALYGHTYPTAIAARTI